MSKKVYKIILGKKQNKKQTYPNYAQINVLLTKYYHNIIESRMNLRKSFIVLNQ